MFTKKDIQQALKIDIKINDVMFEAISEWSKVYNGDGEQIINVASAICYEVSTTCLNEMEIKIDGDKNVLKTFNSFKAKLQNTLELGLAKGGIAIKPYFKDNVVKLEYIQADYFIPVKVDDEGIITESVFIDTKQKGDKYYTRLEHHIYIDNTDYTIANYAFKSSDKSQLGNSISLASVDEWANIKPIVNIAGLDMPLYSYFKTPFANTIDNNSDIGVSIFARAINNIKEANKQYGRLLWEFEGGELAVHASDELFNENKSLPALNKRLFRQFDVASETFAINTFSPELRDVNLINGLNQILRFIELECGLSYGILSDSQIKELTATEVRSSKQRYYSTVSAIQDQLEKSINELLYIIKSLYMLYGVPVSKETEISLTFRDSILSDEQTDRNNDRTEVSQGLMTKVEYRMKWFGEDEETAREKLKEINNQWDNALL